MGICSFTFRWEVNVDIKFALANLNPSWKDLLQDEFHKDYFKTLQLKLSQTKEVIYPKESDIFSVYNLVNPLDIKVVILGQDPYHGDNQAHGLAFSIDQKMKLPPSLVNIFKELSSDLNMELPTVGNLTRWAKQGVFLLNTVLTVQAHEANSHAKLGWEKFTQATIDAINRECEHVVFILWGASAQKKEKYIDTNKHLILKSAHPSPLSVYRGFWGSKPFSQANDYLLKHHKEIIQWS